MTADKLRDELRKSEARFRDVIERNADAIVVVDTHGVITFANRMASELFGKPLASLIGHPFGFPVVAGETIELDILREGTTVVIEMRVVESEWEGQPACISTLRDATDRKKAEESARRLIAEQAARAAADKSAARFRFLADASAALAGSLDYRAMLTLAGRLCCNELADWAIVYRVENGEIFRVDAAHRNGRFESLVEQVRDQAGEIHTLATVVDVVRTHQPALISEVDSAWLDEHIHDEHQRSLVDALGLSSLIIVPLIARENVLGAVAIASSDRSRLFDLEDLVLAQDLATRVALALDNARLYNEAKEANQTKTDFLAVISHDLRTPLNAILGYSDLLATGIPDVLTPASNEMVARIRTSAGHLVYLIDELLAYARLESRHDVVQYTEVELSKIAEDVGVVIQPIAASRSLTFEMDLPADAVPLRTDADKLRQVLLNLVSNAVKYTEAGEVRLSAVKLTDKIVIRVSDSGIGIAPQHLQRIFEPFWQVSATQRGPTTGTGLGLSVVRELVQLLSGEISVESEVGKGSTFIVTLPQRGAPLADGTPPGRTV